MNFSRRLVMLLLVFSLLLIPSVASAATDATPCNGTPGQCLATYNLTNNAATSIKYKVDGKKFTLGPGQTQPFLVSAVGRVIKVTADKKKGFNLASITCAPGTIVTKISIKSREVRVLPLPGTTIGCTFNWVPKTGGGGSDSDD